MQSHNISNEINTRICGFRLPVLITAVLRVRLIHWNSNVIRASQKRPTRLFVQRLVQLNSKKLLKIAITGPFDDNKRERMVISRRIMSSNAVCPCRDVVMLQIWYTYDIHGLMQDCSNSTALAVELLSHRYAIMLLFMIMLLTYLTDKIVTILIHKI